MVLLPIVLEFSALPYNDYSVVNLVLRHQNVIANIAELWSRWTCEMLKNSMKSIEIDWVGTRFSNTGEIMLQITKIALDQTTQKI